MANEFIIKRGFESKGNSQVTGSLSVSANILANGSIVGSNLSGTNTGDQDLSALALKTAISGAFVAPSASFSTRVTANDAKLTANTTNVSNAGALMDSEVTDIATIKSLTKAGISGSFVASSASFSTRTTTLESNPVFSSTMISGSFVAPSSSFSTRVTFLEEGGAVGFTSSGISGSLGPNATLIRSLTATGISGSSTESSASFSTRVSSLETKSVFSGSLQGNGSAINSINASNISSGTIAAARVATLNQNTTGNAATATTLATARNINGVSFDGSADITTVEGNTGGTGDTLTAITIGTTEFTVATGTGNGNVETSGTPLDNDYAKFTSGYQIEGRSTSEVKTDLSLNNVENTALSTYTGNGGALDNQYIANGRGFALKTAISGAFVASSASFSTRVTGNALGMSTNASNISSNTSNITSNRSLITGITSSLDTVGRMVFVGSNGTLTSEAGFAYNATTNQLSVDSLNVTHLTSSFITSSNIKTSGSNIFGDSTSDTQTFIGTTFISGAAQITGSLRVSANIKSVGTVIGSNLSGTNTGDQDLSTLALKTAISGSFIAPSSSFSTRVTLNDAKLTANTTNVTSAGALMDSELAEIATVKSLTKAGISGSFGSPSSSFSTRVTFLEEGGAVGFTSSGISGSLGPNAVLIRSLTAAKISGSFGAPSASFSTRVTANDAKLTANTSNVTTAGALMDSEVTDLAGIKGVTISTLQPKPSEGAFANGDKTKLDGIEASADVTDTANVTSAGALMDSELAEIATVKLLTKSGISGSFTELSASLSNRAKFTSIWDVVSPSGGQYEFKGPGLTGTENKPALYLTRGEQYQFNINASGHPFYIQTSAGAYNSGNVYNDGVTGNGTQVGDLDFNVQFDAPTKLYYVCSAHSGMGNIIYIDDFIPETAATASYVAGANVDGAVATATLAADATTLATPRAINGVNFDGSAPITITAAGSTLSDTVTVAKGGTGATSLTANRVLIGNGTSAVTTDSGFTYSSNILGVEGLLISSVSAQNSEATSLMINGDGAVGTRELGSNAFNSTAIPTAAMISGSFTATSASFSTRVTANDAKLTANTSNVTSAGALMDSELTNLAAVKAINQSLVSGATPEFTTTNFTDASNKRLMTDAQETKLDSVETNADVTDTANVTSAGALMDSELAEIATVKTLSKSGISGSFTATSSSFSSRIAANEIITAKTLISGSSQIKLSDYSMGTGLDTTGGGTGLGLDLSEFTDMTGAINTAQDELILLDNGAERRKLFSEIFGSNAYNSTTIGTNTNALTVDNTTVQLNSGTTFNGSAARTLSAKTATIANGGTALATADQIHTFVTGFGYSTLALGTTSTTALAGNTTVGTVVAANPGAGIYDTLERITIGGTSFNIPAGTGNGTVDTSGTPVDNDFAKFTDANTIEGRSAAETKTDLSLNNVENTAISTFAGSTNITTVGTIGTGTWNGTAIADAYLSSNTAHLSGTQTFSGAKTFSSLSSFTMDGNTITGIDDSGEFTDDDAHIMTSAGVNDRITSFGYSTTTGTLTGNGSTNRVPIYNGTTSFTTDSGFTYSSNILSTEKLNITAIAATTTENTTIMINGDGETLTRELGSNAFNSTSYLTTSGKAADSNLLDGLDLHTGRNNVANRVVRTQGNGYIEAGWINTTSGNTTSTITDVYVNTNDGYIRKATNAEFKSQLGIGTNTAALTVSTGLDLNSGTTFNGSAARTISVDVSDFMTNGSNNRIVTATGADAMNAEANLTFDGSSLGLGTSSPGTKLDILDTVDQTSIRVTNNNYNNYLIQKRRTDNSQILGIQEFGSNGGLSLVTGAAQRLNVNNLGNVGIGTTAPAEKLDVVGNIKASGTLISNNGSNGGTIQLGGVTNITNSFASYSNLQFNMHNGSGFSDIMKLQGNGNVGIGTTAPTEKLQLGSGNIKLAGSGGIFVEHSTASVGGQVIFPNGGMYRTNSNAHTGMIKIALPGGTAPADMLSFWVDVYDYTVNESFSVFIGGYAYQTAGQNEWVNQTAMVLSTNHHKNYTVRFGHDSSNHCVLIGETNSSWSYPQVTVRDVQIGYTADIDAYNDGWVVSFVTSSPTVDETESNNFPFAQGLASTANIPVYFGSTEEFRFETDGDFHADGDVVAQSTSVSDSRLKDNIIPIGQALDKIKSLRGVSYTWNSGKKKGKQDIGLIAQEVEKVIPEIVKDKKMPLMEGADPEETYKTIDYEKIIAVLVEAVKDQQTQIDDLKKQIKK